MTRWKASIGAIALIVAACGDGSQTQVATLAIDASKTTSTTLETSTTLPPPTSTSQVTSTTTTASEPTTAEAPTTTQEWPVSPSDFMRRELEEFEAIGSWSHFAEVSYGDGSILTISSHFDGEMNFMNTDLDGQTLDVWEQDGLTAVGPDGTGAFVFPMPAGRSARDSFAPEPLLLMAVGLTPVDVAADGGLVSLTFRCESRADLPSGFMLAQACGPASGTVFVLQFEADAQPNFQWRAEGQIELWPGNWTYFEAAGSIGPLDSTVDLDFPEASDEMYRCLADELRVDPGTPRLVSEAIRDTTTVENKELFQGCGYSGWPPGPDLRG